MASKGFKQFIFGFSSEQDEIAFQKVHHNPKEARIIIFFVILIYGLYLFQDHFLFPEYFRTIAFIRMVISLPLSIILFFSTYSRYYQRFSAVIFIGLAFSNAAGIILIEYFVRDSPYAGLYFYGIAQVLMVFYGTGKLKMFPSILCGFCILIPAVLVDKIYVESDIYRLVTKSLFMFTVLCLGLIVSTIIQHTARERFLSHRKVEEMSMTDALTGLKNRLFYQNIIIDEILNYTKNQFCDKADRDKRVTDKVDDSVYAYILMDIDNFKRVNDSFGHEAGDYVLKELSNRIQNIVRLNDSLIRWGGEEFLLLLRNTRSEYIELLIERILNEVSGKPFKIGAVWQKITVSGGVFIICRTADSGQTNPERPFELADKALYFSKENGRNRFTQIIVDESTPDSVEHFKILSPTEV